MSLKSNFDSFIDKFGFKVLVVIQDKEEPCTHCWDAKTRTAKPGCPYCLGTRNVVRVEEHTVRSKIGTVPQTLPKTIVNTPFGTEYAPSRFYYVKKDCLTSLGDLIYDRTEDIIYTINSIEYMRLGEEVQYYRLAVTNLGIKNEATMKENILNIFGG